MLATQSDDFDRKAVEGIVNHFLFDIPELAAHEDLRHKQESVAFAMGLSIHNDRDLVPVARWALPGLPAQQRSFE